jgi:hypothetical protein
MGKAGKAAAWTGLAVVAVAAIAAAVVLGRLDRRAVETVGPAVTGTDVSLGSADVSIFDGAGELRRLSVASPDGFTGGDALKLGRIAVQVELKSLAGAVVRVKSLVVDGPEVLAESDAAGRTNLQAILEHARAAGRNGAGANQAEGGGGAKLIVEEFRFQNARLRVLAPAYAVDETVELPPIVLKNVGTAQGGLAPPQLASQLLRPVVDEALRAAMKKTLGKQREKLEEKAKEELFDKVLK